MFQDRKLLWWYYDYIVVVVVVVVENYSIKSNYPYYFLSV